MKTISNAENAILIQAERMDYLVQECISFKGCFYIIDMNTNIVIAGAQDFLAWEEVVRWVQEADTGPTLN